MASDYESCVRSVSKRFLPENIDLTAQQLRAAVSFLNSNDTFVSYHILTYCFGVIQADIHGLMLREFRK